MIKVHNKHTLVEPLSNSIYIGRGSIFGNPYTHKNLDETMAKYQVSSRKIAIESYREYMEEMYKTNPEYRKEIDNLVKMNKEGKDINLICFCKPKSCHGDILKEFIETLSQNDYSLW